MRNKNDKLREKMERFGIDLDNYDLNELRYRNGDAARNIAASLAGSKLYSMGALLSGDAGTTFIIELNRAQVEQNFILMRQNEEIIRWLKAIYGQRLNG